MKGVNTYFLARGIQHVVIAAVGLVIVWMGYRLFRDMPQLPEGETKFLLPGGISIWFSRVGPGAFFVLFGSGLIGYTSRRAFTYQQQDGATSVSIAGFAARSTPASGAAAPPSASADLPRPGLVRTLAELAAENDGQPITKVQIDRATALRAARVQIMLTGWDRNWGSKEDFRHWIDSGASGPPPETAGRAAEVYLGQ